MSPLSSESTVIAKASHIITAKVSVSLRDHFAVLIV